MPLMKCTSKGKSGWKYGPSGKCYTGSGAKEKAIAQELAIKNQTGEKMEFKGFDDWIEIFRGGIQIDSSGRKHDGNGLIDKAIATFDASTHEPPVVVGHPKTDDPAYGWVENIRKSDQNGIPVLEVKIKQVASEFQTAVENGWYKKRSAAFFPDGRLRHVGFLGGAAPAVAGLRNIAFGDSNEIITFESPLYSRKWAWGAIKNVFTALREFLIDKYDKATADQVVRQMDISDLIEYETAMNQQNNSTVSDGLENISTSTFSKGEKQNMDGVKDLFTSLKEFGLKIVSAETANDGKTNDPGKPVTFSAEDLNAKIEEAKKTAAEEAAKKATEKAQAEFNAQREKDRIEAEANARRSHIETVLKGLVEAGKINPALSENLKTLAFSAEGLLPKDHAGTIAFAASADKAIENHKPVDWLLHILGQKEKSPLFGEFAAHNNAANQTMKEDDQMARRIARVKEEK